MVGLLLLMGSPVLSKTPSPPPVYTGFQPVIVRSPDMIDLIKDSSSKPLVINLTQGSRWEYDYPKAVPEAPKKTETPSLIPTVKEAQDYALNLLGEKQYSCLYILWQRESRWNPLAENKSSGAYGIPQALPGSKMAKAGDDWLINPLTQVKWGLGYISGRYGTACTALQHSYDYNWY